MILEHEIPQGSKLYFGRSAKLKREIESYASEIFYSYNYEEIHTPIFSYLQNQTNIDEKEILKLSNELNHQIALRSDSTIDIVRIVTKRVGRSTDHRRWFYIQPVFKYPTSEIFQIGAENLDSCDIADSISLLVEIIKKIEIDPILQVSNMQIPLLCAKECGVELDIFTNANIEKILKIKDLFIGDLLKTTTIEDLKTFIKSAPTFLKDELKILLDGVANIEYKNIILAPLYYSKIEYYNGIYFRMFKDNYSVAIGGSYECDDIRSNGFAIYTDRVLEMLL